MSEQRRPRVVKWIQELQAAGPDEARAKAVLNAVRDDPDALAPDRDHFCRALAQQMFLQFLQCTQGEALSPDQVKKLVAEAQKARESREPADPQQP